jgi:undecaprenyl-diphosphatase
VDVVLLLNGLARRFRWLDIMAWEVAYTIVFQGIMVALFFGAWFARHDAATDRQRRQLLLSSLGGVYATVVLAIALRATLPFRARPAEDAALAFQAPFAPFGSTLHSHSTSLPAGHAAVYFALAIGLWTISVRLGIVGSLVAFFTICLPRIYIGLHYPGDILIGAGLGATTVGVINEIQRGRLVVQRGVAWAEIRPERFYAFLFLAALDVATEFSSIRGILRLLQSAHINKLVMLTVGAVMPS